MKEVIILWTYSRWFYPTWKLDCGGINPSKFNAPESIAMNINSKLLDISFNIQSEYHPYNSVIKSHSIRKRKEFRMRSLNIK